jgi:hypothetical protein
MEKRYFNQPRGYLTVDQLKDRLGLKDKQVLFRAVKAGELKAYTFPGSGSRFFIKEEDAAQYEAVRNTPQPVSVA